jgi:aspartate carbamoyltransferase catalytic subunit
MNGLTTLHGMPLGEIEALLDAGQRYAEFVQSGEAIRPVLAGRTVTTLFYEPSTRTRLSFEKAARSLGADVMTFVPESSSSVKGESFRDTVLTLAAMGSDALVLRHSLVDAAQLAARWSGLPVVNAGTGRREHPTQTLVDALTIRQHFGGLAGLRMAIVGDIANSRVARGHLSTFPRLGMELTLVGPPSLLPPANPWNVPILTELDAVVGEVDIVYLLRVQRERGAAAGSSESTYSRRYGMTAERLPLLKPSSVVMHPGPINRGVEIDDAVADGDRSLILRQVSNGVPVRMAVLDLAIGKSE